LAVTGSNQKPAEYISEATLHDLYSSPSIIRIIKSRKMRWAGHVARMGRRGMRICYWYESQKERDHWKEQGIGRWVDNIRMDLGEVGWGYVDWIRLAQDRNRWRALVNAVMNLSVP
jgi:hypothetical protein